MLIRYEDKRFRQHHGVDLPAMARAVAQALWNGQVVSGGSTLTMQVARLLEDAADRDAGRASCGRCGVALALERRLTKDQILALYLDRAPFGGNLEGVRAAAYAWFGKPPRPADPGRGGAAGGAAAIPRGAPPRPAPGDRPCRPRPGAARGWSGDGVLDAPRRRRRRADRAVARRAAATSPRSPPHLADRVRSADPLAEVHRHDARCRACRRGWRRWRRGRCARPGARLSGRDPGGRPPDGRDPRLRRLRRPTTADAREGFST